MFLSAVFSPRVDGSNDWLKHAKEDPIDYFDVQD